VITVSVDRDHAVLTFDVMLVWDEQDLWRQALELVAEAGPYAILDALEDDDVAPAPAKRGRLRGAGVA
jgi:hypothetical protein